MIACALVLIIAAALMLVAAAWYDEPVMATFAVMTGFIALAVLVWIGEL